jgi:protein TonB
VKSSGLLLSFASAVGLHALLFIPGWSFREAEVPFQIGETSMRLTVRPSLASKVTEHKARPRQHLETPAIQTNEALDQPIIKEQPVTEPEPEVTDVPAPDPVPRQALPEPAPAQPVISPAEKTNSSQQDGDLGQRGVNSDARITGFRKPVYPSISRRKNEEGTVVLDIEIHADGSLGQLKTVRSSGYRRLDRAAREAITSQSGCFRPALRFGKPVHSVKRLTITFRLTDPW